MNAVSKGRTFGLPVHAIRYLASKKIKPSRHWSDVYAAEHATAFTAAQMASDNLLLETHAALVQHLAEGGSKARFIKELAPRLAKMGWRPPTGVDSIPWRLQTIYDSNIRSAYAAGQWERIQKTKKFLPFLLYGLGPSKVHRDQHVAWAGTILPADDPWWDTHFPPNGWGCKCWIRQVSRDEARRLEADAKKTGKRFSTTRPPMDNREWVNPRTGEVRQVPGGINPGWEWNPGKDRGLGVRRAFADHIRQILDPICPPVEMARGGWRKTPAACLLPEPMRDWFDRRRIQRNLRGAGFAAWLDSTVGRRDVGGEVALAALEREFAKTGGLESGAVMLPANLANKIWGKHGPRGGEREKFKLTVSDWLEIQRIVDEVPPVHLPNGRWRYVAPPKAGGEMGYKLVLSDDSENPGRAVPITFFKVPARRSGG